MTLFYSGYSPASLVALSWLFPLLASLYIPTLQVFELSLVLLLTPPMGDLIHIPLALFISMYML